ncbi:MAG: hypothetical protein ACJ75G_10075 [Gaiellaceae bacterium]
MIAMVALFAALGGTSFAATKVITAKHKDVKADTKLVKKLAPSLSVKHAKTANSATTAASATHATSADSATHATSADTATSATTATNANALNGFAANQLVRATTATAGATGDPCDSGISGFGDFESTTFTSIVSKSVTAPVAGLLVIVGHVSSEFSSGTGPGTIRLLGRVAVDGAQAGVQGEATLNDNGASCEEGRTISLDSAVEVTAGDHTVAFQIAKSSTTGGTGGAWVGDSSVTTLFVPFGNAGSQGALGATHSVGVASGSNR